jgi:hypothetical protein
MEYFLLLVLVVLWWIVRSRDRRRREQSDATFVQRLYAVEGRLRQIESRFAESVSAAPSQTQAYPIDIAPQPAPVVDAPPPDPLEVTRPLAEAANRFAPEAPPPQFAESISAERPVLPASPVEPVPLHKLSLEERLGANWLNKLGIVTLVFGIAFFLAFQLRTLGPAGKIVVGTAVSACLLIGGLLLERRDRYRLFARVGIGGGWALTFFVAYAMYHIPATRILSSQLFDLVLMAAVALGMVWHSLRYQSQVVTGLAFLLAFSTVTISQVTAFSLVANALLACGLVYVTRREHWAELELAGLVAVYCNHFLWLHRTLQSHGGPGHAFPEFFASAGLLLLDWFIFRIAYIRSTPRDRREDILTSITAVLNSAGVLALLKYQSAHPEWTFWAILAMGSAEMLLAFSARHKRRTAFVVLSTVASALLLAAIPFRYQQSHWSIFWLLEAEVLFLCGIRMPEIVFRRLGILAGFAALFPLALADVLPIFSLRATQLDLSRHWVVSLTLACAAAIYWFNAEVATRRFSEVATRAFDSAALRLTSYLGMAAAALALWVCFPASKTAPLWMAFALALGYAADKLHAGDLAMETDLLAAAALIRVLIINLPTETHWGPLSQRALSVGLVSLFFYVGTQRAQGALNVPAKYIPIAYSWSASFLLALLCWYQVVPVAVAVGWALLALALLELGILRRHGYLRHQAAVLFAASFARIFFVYLNAGATTQLVSPRLYTVLPLIAAYYWAYERLRQNARGARFDRVMQTVACCCATVALAAVLYFEVRPEWVVIAWAVLTFLLVSVSWLLDRILFLVQGLVLAMAVFLRALLFNLERPPLAHSGLWQRPAASIAMACLFLFASLLPAFRLRRLEVSRPLASDWRAWLQFTLARPEQLLFFLPLVLVTIMLAHEMRAGMITVAWSALGVSVFLCALWLRERSYRLAGLGLLLLGVGKILVIDIWKLAPSDRYITLIVMGSALLLVSFLYTRYREAILKLL